MAEWYTEDESRLSVAMGWFICSFVSCFYVISMYVFIPAGVRKCPRNDATHIKWRMFASSAASILSAMLVVWLLETYGNLGVTIPEAMGFRLDTATDAISVTCILMSIFYLGPLITKLIFHYNCSRYDVTARGMAKNINHRAPFIIGSIYEHNMAHFKMYPTIIIVRNLVFAPISEEIAYRSLLIPILDMMYVNFSDSPWGDDRNSAYLFVAACCPLLFSVAHIHHLREHVLSGVPLPSAISAVAIQVVYTGIFAFIAAILFMRTGNILSAITSHVICNFVGLPDFSFMEPANTTRATPLSCLYKWRYVLLFFHGAGLAMFGVLLIPFTNNFNTVYWH